MKKPSAATANQDKRLYTQLRNLRNIFDLAVTAVFAEKRALDRFLSSYWRENRCFGSRDRRLFSESIFAFFRFYGWLKLLLTEEECAALAAGRSRQLAGRTAAMLLAGAWQLENLPPEAAHHLLTREFELPSIPAPDPEIAADPERLRSRFMEFARHCKADPATEPAWEALQAEWSLELLQTMPDQKAYYQMLSARPPLWLRIQNADPAQVICELTGAGLTVKRHPRLPQALAVTAGSVNLYTLEAYRAGRIEVQDLASQVIAQVCAPRRSERWWDCCAGAGGKTLALAELMERTGKVVAGDIRAYKLEDLKKRARRSGFPNIETRPWDGNKVPPRKSGSFDGILIDAPCSCSGVWRRNPDGRWSSTPDEVEKINLIQKNVLENVLPALRPGGVLVYATCSVFESENSAMIADFLRRHSEFVLESFADPLTGDLTSGMLKISGARDNSDSMFVARLRKK
ncbi:MAG: RsmB/NOP family class I SAM-dependent RNA methyltransferase [Lentisphaeria bacterium]|nr:RsmB/NOP family class I SAM-dependent RNA methyltransferase [Lentisphaeria bacterium]